MDAQRLWQTLTVCCPITNLLVTNNQQTCESCPNGASHVPNGASHVPNGASHVPNCAGTWRAFFRLIFPSVRAIGVVTTPGRTLLNIRGWQSATSSWVYHTSHRQAGPTGWNWKNKQHTSIRLVGGQVQLIETERIIKHQGWVQPNIVYGSMQRFWSNATEKTIQENSWLQWECSELESKMERTEMRMVRCWGVFHWKTAQDWTEKMPSCRSIWRCDGKMQTAVAWTCGKKGRCRLCEGMCKVGGGRAGACRQA